MNAEDLRIMCLSLPHVTEDVKWDTNLCFLIGEKLFCLSPLDGEFGAVIKVPTEDFENWMDRPGFNQAPYFAKRQWVHITAENDLTADEWIALINQSYQLIKSKLTRKKIRELEGEDG